MSRKTTLHRATNETDVTVKLDLDGKGKTDIDTGIGFLDHMLIQLAVHGMLDLYIKCQGDIEVDGHHTVEDIGIVLGKCFAGAVGNKKDINRYATIFLPMDESMAMVSIDISGRPYLYYEIPLMTPMVGDFDTQLIEEFFRAFAVHGGMTLHIKVLYGKNTHHMIEAIFKAFARAINKAASLNPGSGLLSSKGILD